MSLFVQFAYLQERKHAFASFSYTDTHTHTHAYTKIYIRTHTRYPIGRYKLTILSATATIFYYSFMSGCFMISVLLFNINDCMCC